MSGLRESHNRTNGGACREHDSDSNDNGTYPPLLCRRNRSARRFGPRDARGLFVGCCSGTDGLLRSLLLLSRRLLLGLRSRRRWEQLGGIITRILSCRRRRVAAFCVFCN